MVDHTQDETKLQNVLTELFLKAYEDGIITNDEHAILNQVKLDAQKYAEELQIALEDHIITSDERNKLLMLKKDLLQNAYEKSREDNIISKDEKALISLLIKILVQNEDI
jgi:hypothetical protein